MSLPCNINIANYVCPTPKKIGGRECDLKAIVLVPLNLGYEHYIPQVLFPYINESFSPIPISVHYAISQRGEIGQFVGLQDTALGLRTFNSPIFTNRPIPTPTTKSLINCPYIFIGVEVPYKQTNGIIDPCPVTYEMPMFQRAMLQKLICCISKQVNLTPSITSITDGFSLDSRLDSFKLPTDFVEEAINVFNNNCDEGVIPCPQPNPTPNPIPSPNEDCDGCTDDSCCPLHKAQIAELTNTVNSLNSVVATLQTQVNGQVGQITTLQSSIAEVNAHYQQILNKFDLIEDCFNCLCPQVNNSLRIEYELAGSENAQQLMPLAPTRLRMPIQVADQSPALVNSSSYFLAQLSTQCNYIVQITATLDASEYFAGSEVWVDMITCAGRSKIASQIVNGAGVVSLFGQATFSPTNTPCDVYFEMFTNDNLDGSRKIEYANVKIQCS